MRTLVPILALFLTVTVASAGEVKPRRPASQSPMDRWSLQALKHWQKRTDPDTDTATPEPPGPGCSLPGMVRVEGNMLQGPIESLQDQVCDHWINTDFPQRCGVFNSTKWHAKTSAIHKKAMAFCIDKFEYPDVREQNPWILMTYYEARDLCQAQHKRLCSDEEWTFACEGEEGLPYPYGYVRDPAKCNADTGWKAYHGEAFAHRTSMACVTELDRLWLGEPSGSRADCVSPFGVYDLTGNIDEWTHTRISGGHYQGTLKGGYWGPVRARCRPSTIIHSEDHLFYQQGTRCCADH
ncbi:MAG TPA: SUMF1/EgtB/PvdO family nonheme iron enzyme [Bdellovibrionota bacterium]|jgi:hypothetical protein|nr:SUMF1/EgtB/PvdO family nonheme iron enzyme [Bdellovibrionota bacterium]